MLHVAADLATDPTYGEMSPDRMYAGLFDATQNVLDSIEKAGTVKRLVYTSSTAAVMGPQSEGAPQPHIYSEDDWSGGTYESLEERWQGGWTIEKNAYAVGKVECEKMTYAWGDKTGIDVVTSCPCHVLGPLLCKAHDTIWQHRLGEIFAGRYSIDMMWNICDVRDIAQSQRLMLETEAATNGTRYMNVSPGDVGALDSPDAPNRASGEPTARELVDMLKTLYPDVEGIGGPKPMTPDRNSPLARCHKAEQELGLRCHIIMDTLKDTIDTLIAFGAIDEVSAAATFVSSSQDLKSRCCADPRGNGRAQQALNMCKCMYITPALVTGARVSGSSSSVGASPS